MPESLIALGILVVVAVVLDGLRRMRNSRRDSLQMSLNMHQGIDRGELDEFGNEFPSGGGRVVAHRTDADDEPELLDGDPSLNLADTNRRRAIDFEQVAPMLMDVKDEHKQQRIEPGFDSDADGDPETGQLNVDTAVDDELGESLASERAKSNAVTRGTKNPSPVFDTATAPLGLGESEVLGKPRVFERPADQQPPRPRQTVVKPSKPVIKAIEERGQQNAQAEQKMQQLPLEDVIIVSVMARDRGGFSGAALLEIMLAQGLRYGHRSIFHCYTGEEREEESLYSVANAVKPGTFDLNKMESFHTPGITLFLALPSPGDKPMEAFDSMLTTARTVAEQLNGELRDENRSVMMGQTIEHCRQRIRDFDMQCRLRAR